MILACVVLTQYRSVTDGQTDAQTMVKMGEASHTVTRKNGQLCVIAGYCRDRLEMSNKCFLDPPCMRSTVYISRRCSRHLFWAAVIRCCYYTAECLL